MSVFDDAKKYIGRALIEQYFPGGDWKGQEYWLPSPLRADRSTGSFHIYEYQDAWCYKDFADSDASGDIIKLVSLVRGLSLKEAAEDIIKSAGGVISEPAKKTRKPKIAAVIPIPEEAAKLLNIEVKSDWAKSTHGNIAAGWKYYTKDAEWCFSVARYNKDDGSKDVIPYYYGTDSRWHEGQAYADGRPLYGLVKLLAHPTWRVVIVEGEKCTDAGNKWAEAVGVEIVFVSWSSGSGSTGKSDFAPLTDAARDGRAIVWPDADKQYDKDGKLLPWIKQPGMKAALAIANRLPGLKVLDVEALADVKDGYDIADAIESGTDPLQIIDGPLYAPAVATPDDESAQFFRFLGYTDTHYWFLNQAKRSTQTIPVGSFNGSKLQELAPLAWWGVMGMITDREGIKVPIAQDYIVRKEKEVGRYNPDILRGAGVWIDDGEIIINDGRRIVTRNGEKIEYVDFQSQWVYLSSEKTFSDMTGEAATIAEGFDLAELVNALGFTQMSSALAVLGWALIAPFGGILDWRPHIWLSGKAETGKSWVIQNIINELLGKFAIKGSGKTSEASLRRDLQTDACPASLDEMEPKNQKAREKIESILELERNSSSDASGYMTICGPDGGILKYRIHSCFCNASVVIPSLDGAADGRIIKCELKWFAPEKTKQNRKRIGELVARCMKDPTRFQRRIFRALPRILDDIKAIKENKMLDGLGSRRNADQWAPLFCSAWALVSDESVTGENGRSWVAGYIDDISGLKADAVDDEDAVVAHILSAIIEDDNKKRRTIAELLVEADSYGVPTTDTRDTLALLSRSGITLIMRGGRNMLAIATRSDAITKMLRDTSYGAGYDAQIRRHALCANPAKTEVVHFGAASARARLLEWKEFREMYMGTGGNLI